MEKKTHVNILTEESLFLNIEKGIVNEKIKSDNDILDKKNNRRDLL